MRACTVASIARHNGWAAILSKTAAWAGAALIAFGFAGCSESIVDSPPAPGVAAPGQPINFAVVRTLEATLSADLSWSAPTTGDDPATYEIYRSTTAGTVYDPANHLVTVPAVAGQTNYTVTDNAGLTAVDTYWVVSAKNAGGETPTAEVMYKPIGGGGGGDSGFGNNFSAALVFADDIGISGLVLDPAKTWTSDLTQIDLNTGLRPTAEQVTALAALTPAVTTLPYLNPATIFPLGGVDYYKQQSVSTWQGQWVKGKTEAQHVNAAWGDNLVSQALSVNSTVRVEMVLSKALTTAMTSYTMQSLYGAQRNEIQGTDGTTYDNMTAFVFASNAHFKIQKLDGSGNPDGTALYDQTLWMGDGPGYLAGEVNVSGNFTYGFVWNLKNQVMPPDVTTGKAGTYRLTFSLDEIPISVKGTPNNTYIDTVSNGTRLSETEVYIDINVAP